MNYSKYKSILEFLPNDINRYNLKNEALGKFLKNFIKNNNISNVLLSLSGGIDSMVLVTIIKNLNIDINLFCCHLNYNNRDESCSERDFLIDWCKYENIHLDILNIDHIKRGDINRNDYEEETRSIRYNYYKTLIEKYNCSGVLLAHHRDDLSENVFNNIMRGRKSITDLSVFKEINTIMGVTVFRPMLEFRKNIIYNISEIYQIPYFLDTTPDWSCRGKMRRQIFPKCEDCYTDSFMNSLVKLGKESDELGLITRQFIIEPILNKVIYGSFGFSIVKSKPLRKNIIFTSTCRDIFNKLNISNIRQKALNNLLDNYDNYENIFVIGDYIILNSKNNFVFVSKEITKIKSYDIDNVIDKNEDKLINLVNGKITFKLRKKKYIPNYKFASFNKYFKDFKFSSNQENITILLR